jgi:hypothetical protein
MHFQTTSVTLTIIIMFSSQLLWQPGSDMADPWVTKWEKGTFHGREHNDLILSSAEPEYQLSIGAQLQYSVNYWKGKIASMCGSEWQEDRQKICEASVCSCGLLKVNQIRSVTDCIEDMKMSKHAGWGVLTGVRLSYSPRHSYHRLGGKPNFRGRGMSQIGPGYGQGPGRYMGQAGCSLAGGCRAPQKGRRKQH